ncbi:MAG: hypothetical protein IMW99_03100 [Firmicutes bacterium]|nr:hypothetical protein [Bacillota bacterium]
MPERYLCPNCLGNRARFMLIFRVGQEILKDPRSGVITYQAPEWEMVQDGTHPYVDVRCLSCGYEGYERLFIQAARRVPLGHDAARSGPEERTLPVNLPLVASTWPPREKGPAQSSDPA